MTDHFAYFFNCTPVGRGSDYDGPTQKIFMRWAGPELFMSVNRHTGLQLMFFFSAPVFQLYFSDNPWISKCLHTWFLLSPYFCFIIGVICDIFVARNDSRMS